MWGYENHDHRQKDYGNEAEAHDASLASAAFANLLDTKCQPNFNMSPLDRLLHVFIMPIRYGMLFLSWGPPQRFQFISFTARHSGGHAQALALCTLSKAAR